MRACGRPSRSAKTRRLKWGTFLGPPTVRKPGARAWEAPTPRGPTGTPVGRWVRKPGAMRGTAWAKPDGNGGHLSQVGGCGDQGDPGQRARLPRVDAVDRRMGMGTAQHHRVQHLGKADVIDILPPPREEARVFLSFDRGHDDRHDAMVHPRTYQPAALASCPRQLASRSAESMTSPKCRETIRSAASSISTEKPRTRPRKRTTR